MLQTILESPKQFLHSKSLPFQFFVVRLSHHQRSSWALAITMPAPDLWRVFLGPPGHQYGQAFGGHGCKIWRDFMG